MSGNASRENGKLGGRPRTASFVLVSFSPSVNAYQVKTEQGWVWVASKREAVQVKNASKYRQNQLPILKKNFSGVELVRIIGN